MTAFGEYIGTGRDVEGSLHVLFHQHHAHPLGTHRLNPLEHFVDYDRGQPEGGLVHQQKPGPGHQRPADGDHLLLSPAEASRELVSPLG